MARTRYWYPLLLTLGALGCARDRSPPQKVEARPQQVPPLQVALTPIEQLGRNIFFDTNLSEPPGQSCAVCHGEETGWTGPDEELNKTGSVYEGAVPGRFGNRKAPSIAYLARTPVLNMDSSKRPDFTGGLFWDGRATGERLGPLVEQAQGPFLNPVEQNLPSPEAVVNRVCVSSYAELFKQVFGDVCGDPARAYDDIGRAIAAWESSAEVNPFSSKYDAYLAKKVDLTDQEKRGLQLFKGKARCDACHPSTPGPQGEPPLFTDFTYDNLGVPRNPDNPWYGQTEFNPAGAAWDDPGLGGFLRERPEYRSMARANLGKFRVPSLRNADKRPRPDFVKSYGHNGYFKSLQDVVHFYNTRDTLPLCAGGPQEVPGRDCWPEPEVGLNLNVAEMGDLGLTEEEEAAIVAFLQTLTDGFTPPPAP
ncbi:cytochrome-c peroxidase [Myxococcus sp. RHSTA-1-4]|uniref:cytochrome-c peroxidase n=1 Tax=Myxococcus sp. RHSTA-1-4 TaxID=2874601 RepID=UPI001CBD9285|nr:cytochrome c peroxidase [Myxococcus sp. RHSTA-1-4]MBZ4420948.1 cytochrome C [Myxococcus sp. RHSTA-1-4]